MALLHELAETYLTACHVEGKARSTIRGYRESLTRLQEVGARLEFDLPPVFIPLAELVFHP